MFPSRPVLHDPTLRMAAFSMLAMGALNASIYPYQSQIAIQEIGLSEPAFGIVLVLASAIGVVTALLLGILSDMRANRRRIAVATTLCGSAGVGVMLVWPGLWVLILSHGILFPVAMSLYGQVFALARIAADGHPAGHQAIQSIVRAAMSLSFLAMLVFWTLAFGHGAGVMSVYISAAIASLALSSVILLWWPRDEHIGVDGPGNASLAQTLRDIARGPILLRLVCLGAISSVGNLYMVLISLVFVASPSRDAGDVALYVGLIAGFEVPFMLLLPRLIARVRRTTLLGWGTALYCLHVGLLPVLAESASLWLLTLLGGLGGTAIIMLPIVYYQDILIGRPGAAGALIAVQRLIADAFAASVFVIGTALGDYRLTAALGVVVAMAGAASITWADRGQKA